MSGRLLLAALIAALLGSGCESGAPEGQTGFLDVAADVTTDTGGVLAPVHGCVDSGCDDGLSCTIDTCDESTGLCAWSLLPTTCAIGGTCMASGDLHPGDACRACAPEMDALGWTDVESEACEPVVIAPPVPGDPCDDLNPCTVDDVWGETACEGVALACPDGGPCLEAVCDAASDALCVLVPADGPCDDGDPCTEAGVCAEGVCQAGTGLACDDGNPCTIDHCDGIAGCTYLPTQSACCVGTENVCDDGNPCTDDFCDAETADCDHQPNIESCDDGSDCTVDDICLDGSCLGAPMDCDDGNPCTQDYCVPGEGCILAPQEDGPCDDGLACSTGDACVAGVCEADFSACLCELEPDLDFTKVTHLALGLGGHPGQALDVDGNPATCAPSADCSGGMDNALGLISTFANPAIADAVQQGDVALVVSFEGHETGAFLLGVYEAQPVGWACDWQTETCAYNLDTESVDPATCLPLIALDAISDGANVIAGGPGYLFPFSLPLADGVSLEVLVHDTQLVGTYTVDASGDVTGFDGVLGGAISKADLITAIAALPDEGLPVDKALISAVMDAVEADIDTDGDGVGDASSIGFTLEGINALAVGFQD
jgi:hypothetical protein